MNTTTEPLLTITSDKKIYTKKWVFIASYIGGPIAGCYLVSRNFIVFGQKELAKKVLTIGVIASLFLFAILVFIPDELVKKIPKSLIPITYSVLIYQYLIQTQGKAIDEHLKNGGRKHSRWKVIGISLIALVLTLLYFFAWVLVYIALYK